MGTLPPRATPPSVAPSLYSRSPPTPPTPAAAADAASAPLRASFVSEILSVPLLPSRLGVDGVDLLLKDRTGAFTDCLRDFREGLAAAGSSAAAGAASSSSSSSAAAAAGKGGAKDSRAKGGGATGAKAGAEKNGEKPAADRGGGGFSRSWGSASSQRSSTDGGAAAAGGEWGAFHLPPPPVPCCSTEAFLLGNVVALGTKLSVESGRASGGGGGAGVGLASQEKTGRRDQREFMRAVTSLLELQVRCFANGGRQTKQKFLLWL